MFTWHAAFFDNRPLAGDVKSAEILAISKFNTHMTAVRLITVTELNDYERSVMLLYNQLGVVII